MSKGFDLITNIHWQVRLRSWLKLKAPTQRGHAIRCLGLHQGASRKKWLYCL